MAVDYPHRCASAIKALVSAGHENEAVLLLFHYVTTGQVEERQFHYLVELFARR